MHNDVIFFDESIVGFADDIIFRIKDEQKRGRIDDDDEELTQDLLQELAQHDGLVICRYQQMGAWYVADLIEA